MSRVQTFIRVLGERNTGTRAMIQMMRAQAGVRMFPAGEGGPGDPPELAGLKAQVEAIDAPWRAVYRDALRDMVLARACPVKMWKHGRIVPDPAFAEKRAHLVFCVRDPYSWVISLAKNPYHLRGPMPATLAEFVARPWLTMGRDNMDAVLESPLELWNGKNRAYRDFAMEGVPVEVVRFEDFVVAPEREVMRVLDAFGVAHEGVARLEQSTKDGRSAEELATYYAREGWTGWLTRDVVAAINARVDWDVAAAFGYARRDPADFPVRLSRAVAAGMRARIGRMGG